MTSAFDQYRNCVSLGVKPEVDSGDILKEGGWRSLDELESALRDLGAPAIQPGRALLNAALTHGLTFEFIRHWSIQWGVALHIQRRVEDLGPHEGCVLNCRIKPNGKDSITITYNGQDHLVWCGVKIAATSFAAGALDGRVLLTRPRFGNAGVARYWASNGQATVSRL
jgi:hypothetical protein